MADITVLSVGASSDSLRAVATPDDMTWGLQDISAADAGRTHDRNVTMQKMRLGQKRKIQLAWVDTDRETTAAILRAFNPEYVWVRYLDAMEGEYVTRQFYVGDRTAPLRQIRVGDAVYSRLSFDIIER